MSSTTGEIAQPYPGQIQPAYQPPPAGSNGSPYQNGQAISAQNTDKLMRLNSTGGYKSRKRNRRFRKRTKIKGGTGSIVVAVPPVSYPESGSSNQTIAGVTTEATKVGTTSTENQVYDQCVGQPASCTTQAQTQSGGKRRRKRGGYTKWGCMSGGRKLRKSRRRQRSRRRKKRSYKNKYKSRKFRK